MSIESLAEVHPSGYTDWPGACLQDFETTLQSYFTPSQLLGVLNFSALWNPITYIYDTAIGDNPHIIESYFASDSRKGALYSTVSGLIKEGALHVLLRDSVQVNGTLLFEKPRLSQVYEGWRARDGNDTTNFLTQHHGDERRTYNRKIDSLLDEKYAIRWYDPNKAKPEFRSIIRSRLETDAPFRRLVFKLPREARADFVRNCERNPYMTTVDLWRLVRSLGNANPAARELAIAIGYMNQRAIAQSVDAGVSGSRTGRGYLPVSPLTSEVRLLSPGELVERADLTLDAPPLDLIGKLTFEDIIALRKIARGTIFLPISNARETTARKDARATIEDYWKEVCSYIDTTHPEWTRRKVKVYAYVDQNIPTFKRWYRRSGVFKESVEVLVNTFAKVLEPSGTLGASKGVVKSVAATLVYTKTDEFRALESAGERIWKPNAAWSNHHAASDA